MTMEGKRNDSRLGTNFKSNATGGSLAVIDSLGTSLNIGAHAVVVARRKELEVAETVEGDGVLRGTVAESSGVLGDSASLDIVRGLTTKEEAITANDGIGSEDGSLTNDSLSWKNSIKQWK